MHNLSRHLIYITIRGGEDEKDRKTKGYCYAREKTGAKGTFAPVFCKYTENSENTDLLADDLQEIRLRTSAPLLVVAKDQEYFLTPDGALTGEWEKGYPVSPTDIRDTMDYIGSFFPLRLRG